MHAWGAGAASAMIHRSVDASAGHVGLVSRVESWLGQACVKGWQLEHGGERDQSKEVLLAFCLDSGSTDV